MMRFRHTFGGLLILLLITLTSCSSVLYGVSVACFAYDVVMGNPYLGGGGGGGSCTSALDQSQSSNNYTLWDIYGAKYVGQSFQPSVSGELYSVSFALQEAYGNAHIVLRVDDDTDMSSEYMAQAEVDAPTAGNPQQVELVFETRPTLTADTTYYFWFMNTGADYNNRIAINYYRELTDIYTRGQFFWEGTSWSNLIPPDNGNKHDLNFRTYMCE